jgi:hypothetical protein
MGMSSLPQVASLQTQQCEGNTSAKGGTSC